MEDERLGLIESDEDPDDPGIHVTGQEVQEYMAEALAKLLMHFPKSLHVTGTLILKAPERSLLVVTSMTDSERAGVCLKLLNDPISLNRRIVNLVINGEDVTVTYKGGTNEHTTVN